jgi:hypothetical protein
LELGIGLGLGGGGGGGGRGVGVGVKGRVRARARVRVRRLSVCRDAIVSSIVLPLTTCYLRLTLMRKMRPICWRSSTSGLE